MSRRKNAFWVSYVPNQLPIIHSSYASCENRYKGIRGATNAGFFTLAEAIIAYKENIRSGSTLDSDDVFKILYSQPTIHACQLTQTEIERLNPQLTDNRLTNRFSSESTNHPPPLKSNPANHNLLEEKEKSLHFDLFRI